MQGKTKLIVLSSLGAAALGVMLIAYGCHTGPGWGRSRLVEQFDNGPVGGPPGPSEGYLWVRDDDHPPAGKGWKPTDPKTLTPDQKTRIRSWP